MTESSRRRAVRLVVVLLIANLALGAVFAALTLIFRQDVLGYQLARHPGADRAALERTLWTRPMPILVVAVLYFWVARQLLAGVRRAYRRVRIVSAAGLLAVGWLLVTAAYPAWLRIVQGGQVALLAALIVAVNRRAVRASFTTAPPPDARPRNRHAALLLIVLAPVVAELSLGNVPLRMAWLMLVWTPIYGAGALFLREVVRRTGGGHPHLLLAGVAYGLVEEGLALQSLTSPHLYGAAAWAPRLAGLNTAYTELNLPYHAVFSVTVPILLVELVFRRHGTAPYLRRGGLIATGTVALLGAVLLRVSVPPTEDPGYTMPLVAVIAMVAAVSALLVLALRVRTGRRSVRPLAPPAAGLVAVVATVATFGFLALLFPFAGADRPFFTHGRWVLAPMAAAALLLTATTLLLRRWAADRRWTLAHLLWACVGALVGHTGFGLLANAETVADRWFLAGVLVGTVVFGVALSSSIRKQEPSYSRRKPSDSPPSDSPPSDSPPSGCSPSGRSPSSPRGQQQSADGTAAQLAGGDTEQQGHRAVRGDQPGHGRARRGGTHLDPGAEREHLGAALRRGLPVTDREESHHDRSAEGPGDGEQHERRPAGG
jgi:hypothetical protein